MNLRRILTYNILALVAIPCLRALELPDYLKIAERPEIAAKDAPDIDLYAHTLSAKINLVAEGTFSKQRQADSSSMPVSRRLVEGGYLIQRALPAKETKEAAAPTLPLWITWLDKEKSDRSDYPWRRIVISERKGGAAITEQWHGVAYSNISIRSSACIYWVIKAGEAGELHGRKFQPGEVIGTAVEEIPFDSEDPGKTLFPNIRLIYPVANDGIQIWVERYGAQ